MLNASVRRLHALTAVVALVAAMLTVTFANAPGARADDCQWVLGSNGQQTCVFGGDQGGGGGGGKGTGVSIDCNSGGTIVYKGKTYACSYHEWTFSGGCYITPMVPQPPLDDPHWGSYDPATYRMQWEDCDHFPPQYAGAVEIAGPCVGYCAGPNPVERITNELQITMPDLGMAPPGKPKGGTGPTAIGYINTNIWLWTKNLDTSTQSRYAGNVSGVRTFVSADWKILKGGAEVRTPLHCTSDYEYTPDKGAAASPDPDCGFTFTTPGDYTIEVTTSWTLVITQNGVPGAPQPITSTANTATITIQEGQTTNG
ncbi:hypothetical protein GCM10009839_04130 [Catenulispora yoronensis]|uniref:Uncharacterized protein n=1 Tax=Catenulispora yoronensis TaxID=450799 RepID=A0ABP5F116_9ACTN